MHSWKVNIRFRELVTVMRRRNGLRLRGESDDGDAGDEDDERLCAHIQVRPSVEWAKKAKNGLFNYSLPRGGKKEVRRRGALLFSQHSSKATTTYPPPSIRYTLTWMRGLPFFFPFFHLFVFKSVSLAHIVIHIPDFPVYSTHTECRVRERVHPRRMKAFSIITVLILTNSIAWKFGKYYR